MGGKSIKEKFMRLSPEIIVNLARVLLYPNTSRCYAHPTYACDGLITTHTCDFLKNLKFRETKRIATKATDFEYEIDWRLHSALWVAKHCSQLKGDFVECGVNRGFLSRAIVHYLDWNKLNKKFYLIDTFEGVPQEYVTKRELAINPHVANKGYGGSYEKVKQVFKDFKNIEIIKGKVPDILPEVKSKAIAYLSLDMNNAYPELKAAEFFWNKMVSGGMILSDDYAVHANYIEQKEALDKFASEKGVDVLTMATGQGLIVKP